MTRRSAAQQQQIANILVRMSDKKIPQHRHPWVGPLSSLQTSKRQFDFVKKLLQRHLGPVGYLLRRKDEDPIIFYQQKVASHPELSLIKPTPNEELFVYLTRLIKYIHNKEKQEVQQAAKVLLSFTTSQHR